MLSPSTCLVPGKVQLPNISLQVSSGFITRGVLAPTGIFSCDRYLVVCLWSIHESRLLFVGHMQHGAYVAIQDAGVYNFETVHPFLPIPSILTPELVRQC